MTDFLENKIFSDTYDLFDKVLYGGLGHGIIVFPAHILKVIFTVLFPPLGIIMNAIEPFLLKDFPYITWDVIKKLLSHTILKRIIYSYILTSLFYIPGLIYTLSHLTHTSSEGESLSGIKGAIICNPYTSQCYDNIVYGAQKAGDGFKYFGNKTDAAFREEVGGGFRYFGNKTDAAFKEEVGGGFKYFGNETDAAFREEVDGGFRYFGNETDAAFREEVGGGLTDFGNETDDFFKEDIGDEVSSWFS
jgi:uncharacterized membrane protein YqaE (UPF0057 family)